MPLPVRISETLLDAIRDRITLSDFIGQHVKLKRHGREWTGLCPFHQERTPSFSVNDQKAIWCCFGCQTRGDVIDFAQHAYRLNFRQAVEVLATENGLSDLTMQIDPAGLQRVADRRTEADAERRKYLAAAQRIWHESLLIDGSPAELYLRSRAITGPLLATLRYHPELRYRVSDKTWLVLPAMVASVTDPDGQMLALHRTFIKRDGSGKADVPKPKLMLGDARGGGIYLAEPGETVSVTEGIETGLSLQAINGHPTIAATSTGGMVALQLPPLPAAKHVTIGADNDANGAGLRAALTAAARWRDEGREVRVEMPQEVKDWNDVLRNKLSRSEPQLDRQPRLTTN